MSDETVTDLYEQLQRDYYAQAAELTRLRAEIEGLRKFVEVVSKMPCSQSYVENVRREAKSLLSTPNGTG
jgi:cell division septum initiation protein DivIVA